MKKFLYPFLFISSFSFSQMPDISQTWLNKGNPYLGTIGKENDKEVLKMKFNISEQDRKSDQEYFISGTSAVQNSVSNFEGKLKITKYKNGKTSKVFGEYVFAEELKGKHSGLFKGNFVYTFKWNKKTEVIENQTIEFSGNWESYDKTLNYKTEWKNQEK